MIKVKVIGASGYGGIGIVELLLRHPETEIQALVALESVGQPISDIYPHLKGFCDMLVLAPDSPQLSNRLTWCSSPRQTESG